MLRDIDKLDSNGVRTVLLIGVFAVLLGDFKQQHIEERKRLTKYTAKMKRRRYCFSIASNIPFSWMENMVICGAYLS